MALLQEAMFSAMFSPGLEKIGLRTTLQSYSLPCTAMGWYFGLKGRLKTYFKKILVNLP